MELQPLCLGPLFGFMPVDLQSIQNWHVLKQ